MDGIVAAANGEMEIYFPPGMISDAKMESRGNDKIWNSPSPYRKMYNVERTMQCSSDEHKNECFMEIIHRDMEMRWE